MTTEQWDMQSFAYGSVGLVTREDRLCRVCFKSSPDEVERVIALQHPHAGRSANDTIRAVFRQLSEYFAGSRQRFDVMRDEGALSGFARKVHRALLEVPCGTVISYQALAARAGSPKAARAVGRVMSSNPFPLIVPCHRVVNADGGLGAYSGGAGAETKALLIDLERRFAAE